MARPFEPGVMRSLYISHIGMVEPLGQSQVLPYLVGLSRRGIEIDILSFETAAVSADDISTLRARLLREGISWSPLVRSRTTRFARKIWESGTALTRGLTTALRRRPDIVHARSYLPAAVADVIATVTPGAKLLFDCRGMLGDEYVDCGHWKRDGMQYRLLKLFERRVFARAEGVVVLTRAVQRWLRERNMFGASTEVETIPCCVDTTRFRPDSESRARIRQEMGLGERLVVVYSGSLGSWYREEEMVSFMRAVKQRSSDAVFLVLTHSPVERLRSALLATGFPAADFRTRKVAPHEMPGILPVADIGLSFIQSAFSKLGSSPTKVAEYLASGVPVVLNGDIGDQAELAEEGSACVVLSSFNDAAVHRAADDALALTRRSYVERAVDTAKVAQNRFGLESVGVPRYERLYRSLAS